MIYNAQHRQCLENTFTFSNTLYRFIGKNKTVHRAIAGPAVRKKAEERGVYVLTQNGDNVRLTNTKYFVVQAY